MSKPKPQTVLKEFSQLKTEERIELTAFAVFQVVHRGERERAFQPRAKTLVHKIWNAGRLSLRQQRAWFKFVDDFHKAEGKSGSVSASYGDYTDKSDDGDFKVPTAYTNAYYQKISRICNALSRREYALLKDLVQNELKATDNIKLEIIGLMRSGYQDKNSARVAGVVNVQLLLDRIADEYGF